MSAPSIAEAWHRIPARRAPPRNYHWTRPPSPVVPGLLLYDWSMALRGMSPNTGSKRCFRMQAFIDRSEGLLFRPTYVTMNSVAYAENFGWLHTS
jgi:hypothetical protein